MIGHEAKADAACCNDQLHLTTAAAAAAAVCSSTTTTAMLRWRTCTRRVCTGFLVFLLMIPVSRLYEKLLRKAPPLCAAAAALLL